MMVVVVFNLVFLWEFGWSWNFDEYLEIWMDLVSSDLFYYCLQINVLCVNEFVFELFDCYQSVECFFVWIYYFDLYVLYLFLDGKENFFDGDEWFENVVDVELDFSGMCGWVIFGVMNLCEYDLLYDVNVFVVDEVVGQFFDYVESLGLFVDVVVVIIVDYGESFGEYGFFFEYGFLFYNFGVYVLLVFWGVGMLFGMVMLGFVGFVDLLLMFCEWFEILCFVGDGVLLLCFYDGRLVGQEVIVFFEVGYCLVYYCIVQDECFKFVYCLKYRVFFFDLNVIFEFFDFSVDLQEWKNIFVDYLEDVR